MNNNHESLKVIKTKWENFETNLRKLGDNFGTILNQHGENFETTLRQF